MLSLGEQQRLAIARVLLARPALALLDESTSALDEANEAALYRALRAAGIALVSVGHRASLRRWHAAELELGGGADGTAWKVRSLEDEAPFAP